MNRVFVYGTLKKGYRNNKMWLSNGNFLGYARTLHPNFDLFSISKETAFPIMTPGNMHVSGEVYEVDSKTLRGLDQLEGHPTFYMREKIQIADFGECWAYVYHHNHNQYVTDIYMDGPDSLIWQP